MMCTTRALLIAFMATVAVASQVPENAVVQEELVQVMDSPEEDADTLMNGGVIANADETVAHDGPTDSSEEVTCAEGEVLCNGSCQTGPCDQPELPADTYSYTFSPKPTILQPAPEVAGREQDYTAEAQNYMQSQSEAEQKAITNAEQSAGFAFASHDASLAAATQRNAALRNEVEKLMNAAAAAAAKFHSATSSHDTSIANVKTAQVEEQKQAHIVELAAATLKKEKALHQKTKEHVTSMVQAEQQARYTLEFDGQEYEKDKAAAIKADNSLQESVHEDEEKEKFRKVAQEAVEKAAAEELKAVSSKQVAEAPKEDDEKEDPRAAAESCSDCTELPQVYVEAGGKCSDCAAWEAKGECEQTEYKTFMHHYCAKSCGCPATVLAQTTMVMPKKA